MKYLLLSFVMLSQTVVVYANNRGPEDGRPATCYSASEYISSAIPQELCLETISYQNEDKLFLSGYNLDGEYKIVQKDFFKEDVIHFIARKNIIDRYVSGCGDAEHADIFVEAVEYHGNIDVRSLNISIDYSYTNDTCHSQPQKKTLHYNLVK